MMAAGQAAQNGVQVLLLEKTDGLGKKLLLTGGGRCNLTNIETEAKRFISHLGKNGSFLYPAFFKFGNTETINFFQTRGLDLKLEKGHKIFPRSDQAKDVLQVLVDYLKENKVETRLKSRVKNIVHEGGKILHIDCADNAYSARNYVIATGGLSYPSTGSSGDGYLWAQNLGHSIIKPRPALMPLISDEKWVYDLQGTSLQNVKIDVYADEQKTTGITGDLMFTHYGVVSPEILNLSEQIGLLLKSKPVFLAIDFFPQLSEKQLDEYLLTFLKGKANKDLKNALSPALSLKLLTTIFDLSNIDHLNQKAHSFLKEDRKKLEGMLKKFKIPISGVYGFDKAIITAGGISLKEIDPQNMRSKLIDNLYLAGEIIDLQGPTGGYNLQIAWSTGYLAGDSASCY